MTENSKTASRPLCVDLDGTLVKTDTFAQALLLLGRTRAGDLVRTLLHRPRNLAALKRRVAQTVQLNPACLPFHSDLPAWLAAEKKTGRRLILVTASDESPARCVAEEIGLFDEVIASDGVTNLKSIRKRDALVERFGRQGFDYAGNAVDDLPIWEAAAQIIAVNPSVAARAALRGQPVRLMDDRPPKWKTWLRALRVHQWTKNVLIFLPMLLAHRLTEPALYLKAAGAFAAFCLTASAIYIVNDLFDLNADQNHPRKKTRPFAAGNLSLAAAVTAVPLLLAAALGLALLLPPAFTGVLLLYLLITTLYSWWLKQTALLDVLTLAFLYALRILAGTAAYGVSSSEWLIAFSMFFFLSLALVKRYAELREAAHRTPDVLGERGRGYRADDLPMLSGFGSASGGLSVLVLALYINSVKVDEFYQTPAALWLLCPLLLYWIGRIWLLAGRGEIADDPLGFAFRDAHTWLIGILSLIVLAAGSLWTF
jgi:4-hydroxybenzoate polyprenyltransferase/phosphoserine phosphatase